MDLAHLTRLLENVRSGALDVEIALQELRHLPYEDLGFARIDHHRALRTGLPEIVYGESKSPSQIATILERLAARNRTVLCSRASAEAFTAVQQVLPHAELHEAARMIVVRDTTADEQVPQDGVLLVAAGTSDLPVAEEAAVTAEAMGHTVKRIVDVGVAGLHRVLACLEDLEQANVIIAVAGMDGVLPGVVSGLVAAPVIAVPTSVGYGAALSGIGPLLTMLNTCSLGMAVVNIDNGVGAGVMAAMINSRIHDGHGRPAGS